MKIVEAGVSSSIVAIWLSFSKGLLGLLGGSSGSVVD